MYIQCVYVYLYIHLICCIILYKCIHMYNIFILSTHVSVHVDGTVTLKLSHIVFSEFVICFSGVTCRFFNLHRPIGSCWIQVSLHHLLSSTSVLFVAGHNLQTLLCTSRKTVPNLQFLFTSSLANNPNKNLPTKTTKQPKKNNTSSPSHSPSPPTPFIYTSKSPAALHHHLPHLAKTFLN